MESQKIRLKNTIEMTQNFSYMKFFLLNVGKKGKIMMIDKFIVTNLSKEA